MLVVKPHQTRRKRTEDREKKIEHDFKLEMRGDWLNPVVNDEKGASSDVQVVSFLVMPARL